MMQLDWASAIEAFELKKGVAEGKTASIAKGARLEGSDFARVVNRTAVVPVKGPLLRTMNWRLWSYEEIQRDVELALGSDEVDTIILDIDSPGGLAAGCGDLSAWLRNQDGKPIVAYVGTMGASAAYMLASGADEIVLGSGAVIGSLGTVIEYVDFDPLFEKLGAQIVRVTAEQSPNKRLDPNSEEGKAELQAICNELCDEFIDQVAEGRGVSRDLVIENYGQGSVFAPNEAISRGMADRQSTLDGLIAELAGRNAFSTAVSATAAKENPMNWESITLAELREHRPDLVADIEKSATDTATAAVETAQNDAVTAERDRILAIDELPSAGHEELVAAAKADGETTAADLAFNILKAEKAAGNDELAARRAADAQASVPASPTSGGEQTVDASAPIEERAKAAWDKDADLRAEFGNKFDAYLAFAKAEEDGRAKIKRAS